MKIIITGCAGFIGSNFLDYLLIEDNEVIGIDNFTTGQKKFLETALKNKKFKLFDEDLFYSDNLINIFSILVPLYKEHFPEHCKK